MDWATYVGSPVVVILAIVAVIMALGIIKRSAAKDETSSSSPSRQRDRLVLIATILMAVSVAIREWLSQSEE